MSTEQKPKALADHIADASKMVTPSNLKQLAGSFPELNMSNYGAEDVDKLHNWALEVVQAITAIDHAVAPVVLPEPEAYLFQHEDTGQTMFVEAQQVEWGFEANNPRLQKISGVYTEEQVRELLDKAACTKSQTTAQEPFGYFKAEPFGWRDCAETDEGAIALYEAPQPQADGRDAQRYRWLIDYFISDRVDLDDAIVAAKTSEDIAKIIDAAIAAAKEKTE